MFTSELPVCTGSGRRIIPKPVAFPDSEGIPCRWFLPLRRLAKLRHPPQGHAASRQYRCHHHRKHGQPSGMNLHVGDVR